MNEQMLEQLRSLRLGGFVQALLEQQESTHYHDMPFEDRLGFLVQKECLRRDNRRLTQRLNAAKIKQTATLDQVDFTVGRGLNKKKFMELANHDWIVKHHNLTIVGPTGVGKSFLASALADQACKLGYSARYFKTSALISEILAAKADGSYPKLTASLARFDLLIIDQWLREPLDDTEAREILDLLDDRFRKASTLFATQFPVTEWYKLIKEPTLAEAILDRIVHDSLRIQLMGQSMRQITSSIKETELDPSLRSDKH